MLFFETQLEKNKLFWFFMKNIVFKNAHLKIIIFDSFFMENGVF
jgi:hypothetical protein